MQYPIEVHTATRTWTIRQRYSAFEELVQALAVESGSPPPGTLPAKRSWTHPFASVADERSLDERRQGLERWVRGIVGAKDPRWRESRAFKDFLAMPVSRTGGGAAAHAKSGSSFSSQSWLTEHGELRSLARSIHALLAKRDALASDPTAAHQTNVQAKKELATLVSRVGILAQGLSELSLGGGGRSEAALTEGEMRRRSDMVSALQDECENLGKLSIATRAGPSSLRSGGLGRDVDPPSAARKELLPSGFGSSSKPPARVLGVRPPPVETAETRPLDNVGLLQLQQEAISKQDDRLSGLSAILRRQKDIGLAINQELAVQNELLDNLDGQLDKTGAKLGNAKKQMKKLDGGA